MEPPTDLPRHLQERPVLVLGQDDPVGVLLPGLPETFQRVGVEEEIPFLVPRPCGPVEHCHQKRQVPCDGPVADRLARASGPARSPRLNEPVPIALGKRLGSPVPAEEVEEHRGRDPVAPPRPLALRGRHLLTVHFKKPSQRERLGLGLAVGLVDREARGGLVGLPLRACPIAVFQRQAQPAPVLPPLDLEQAGFRIGKHPDPVPAPFSGAVGAPTSFRACHRSIPPKMDCTIRLPESSRGSGLSASRATGRATGSCLTSQVRRALHIRPFSRNRQ